MWKQTEILLSADEEETNPLGLENSSGQAKRNNGWLVALWGKFQIEEA